MRACNRAAMIALLTVGATAQLSPPPPAPPCACAAQWTSDSTDACQQTQYGCEPNACDGDGRAWCKAESLPCSHGDHFSGVNTGAYDGDWFYCAAALPPQSPSPPAPAAPGTCPLTSTGFEYVNEEKCRTGPGSLTKTGGQSDTPAWTCIGFDTRCSVGGEGCGGISFKCPVTTRPSAAQPGTTNALCQMRTTVLTGGEEQGHCRAAAGGHQRGASSVAARDLGHLVNRGLQGAV